VGKIRAIFVAENANEIVLFMPADSIVGALYHKLLTQPSAPEDGRNYRPKHIELIEIINKLLLLHLFGCLYYNYPCIFAFLESITTSTRDKGGTKVFRIGLCSVYFLDLRESKF